MSQKISRSIFIAELIIIVLPSALILLIATFVQTSSTFNSFPWATPWARYDFANTAFALLACTALASGLVLSKRFLDQGRKGLDRLEKRWWLFSFAGGVLIISSAAVSSLPPAPEYSPAASFRDTFDYFRLGIPIFIPFTHLILEKYFRKK
jgi:hypothetical protein